MTHDLMAESVTVRRSGKAILDGVMLKLVPGSMNVLLGPNGSGKTTLIRVLAGVVPPTKGRVLMGGMPLNKFSRAAVARHCAYLPQHTSANFDIRVEDAVALGRYAHLGSWGAMTSTDYDLVHWAMDRVGVGTLRQRTLPTLSGGERQRVFLARALAQQAPILLLDEPISSLDIGRQLELMELLTELHQEGRTILAALHDLRPALEHFPTAILLNAGRLVAQGPTNEVILGDELTNAFQVRLVRGEQWCIVAGQAG